MPKPELTRSTSALAIHLKHALLSSTARQATCRTRPESRGRGVPRQRPAMSTQNCSMYDCVLFMMPISVLMQSCKRVWTDLVKRCASRAACADIEESREAPHTLLKAQNPKFQPPRTSDPQSLNRYCRALSTPNPCTLHPNPSTGNQTLGP